MLPSRSITLIIALAVFEAPAHSRADDLDFFEAKIRPVLVDKCYRCHSDAAKKARGGLKLDSRAALRKGGDSGRLIVAGKPAESLLLKAMRHVSSELKMPPDEKLSPAVLADFETWIARGAALPADETPAVKGGGIPQDAAKHWAFQPLARLDMPTSPAHPIDFLLQEQRKAKGLGPSPLADRRTQIRRLTFDLLGLPPTMAEVEAFEKDTSPDAYARLVDALLARPQYGERWARHWLDVARYADTKDGVLMFGDDRIRPFAYTYRDYVIQAFNDDMPFDRFIHEQLAADMMTPPEPSRLAAMGFLTLGRMFDNNVHDVIDDRIDVVTRGLLGLTVSCARCHDHKYDPISTADYYALYGVFASSESPLVPPPLDPGKKGPDAFEKNYAAKEREVRDMLDAQYAMLSETARARVTDYLVHVAGTEPDPLESAIFFLSLAPGDLRPPIVARWRTLLANRSTPDDPVFGPWHDLLALDAKTFPAKAAEVVERRRAAGRGNGLVLKALAGVKWQTRADVARAYGTLLRQTYDTFKKAPDAIDADQRPLLELLVGQDSPAYFPKSQTRRYMSRGDTDAFGRKVGELDKLAVKEPAAPARAMCLVDAPERHEPRIFIRGNPITQGDHVPRRFPTVLAKSGGEPFAHGSGRLDLARAITEHPLSARVLVNRVWMHHFGEPLVASPSDFGLRTAAPTHLELLDYLADMLRREGWSLKKLHRHIVTAHAYRQASDDRPDARAVDPENRLLWRAHRRRLDFEAMRDSFLAISGRLDGTPFGRPVDIAGDPKNRRRSIYGLVDRQSLPGVLRTFDFAVPDQSVERRPRTTVPQQALFGMNAPFMIEQARALAARLKGTDENAIAELYRLALARAPHPREAAAALAFLKEAAIVRPPAQLSPREQLAQVILMTNEVLFVD